MEDADTKRSPSVPVLTSSSDRATIVMESLQSTDSLQSETGVTPNRDADLFTWISCPLGPSVVPETTQPSPSERRLESHEWVELLEQTECLEYISPDVEACMARQHRMEGNQDLDITGREFIDSPTIPLLPPLNAFSAERQDGLASIRRTQHDAPRRPGLREKFPRHQPLIDHNQVQSPHNYFIETEYSAETKRPSTRGSSIEKRHVPPRTASRTLKFDVAPQPTPRRKRSSWNGRSSRGSSQATRHHSKSARKSKDCSIPGCTKGARSRGLCKRHGGGKRCTHPECSRSDQGGGFCIAHGGGKRCSTEGCKNSAQSRGLCKSHGGGKRCSMAGCSKSSQEGGLCRIHGIEKAAKNFQTLSDSENFYCY